MKSPKHPARPESKGLALIAALLIVTATAGFLFSETLNISATYPSPVGIYNYIVTTGGSSSAPTNTTLNRTAGNAILVPSTNASGRVGIGTASPASVLDVSSTQSAFLPPRMTTAQRDAISAPPAGSVLYNTTTSSLEYYGGSGWLKAGGSSGLALFESNGTFVVPQGVTKIYVTAAGGGGGGSGGCASGRSGSGGGSGAAVYKQAYTVTPLQSLAITIGAGGTAGAGCAAGGAGTSTIIGALATLAGGAGATTNGIAGGAPGGAGGQQGGGGTYCPVDHIAGGTGGGNIAGGIGSPGSNAAIPGIHGGGGGGGHCGSGSSAAAPGGAGFALIEWY